MTTGKIPPTGESAPHLGRLLARLAELPSPVVQIWGWPGTGKRELLEALLEREGPPRPGKGAPGGEPAGARPLARAEVEDEERLRETLERPEVAAARWLVGFDLPPEAVESACRLLRPGQRLISAGSRRLEIAELPVSFLPPGEVLLTREEARTLWRARASGSEGADVGGGELVWGLTSGWLTPLRLAARAVEEGALDPPPLADERAVAAFREALVGLPPLRAFLRHEVLDPLPPEVRSALVRAALVLTALVAEAREEAPAAADVAALLAPYGWAPEPVGASTGERSPGGPPPPKILGAFLRNPSAPASVVSRGTEREREEPDEPRPQARIALLGPPRVTLVPETGDAEELEIHWPLKRALRIIAYLASSEDFQAPRDDLTAAMWPEDDEERIARNFHPTLSHLRRTFRETWEQVRGAPAPEPLVFLHDTYRLNTEIVWEVDVVELSAATERGRRVAAGDPHAAVRIWRRAVGLVRGPFLAGTYDAWAEPLREQYQRRWLNLLRELAGLYARLDRFTEAVDAYRRVLIEDPLEESVHQALMRVYARQGRRDLVRRQYDRLANLLAEDLGVEPLAETTEEYHRLMG